MVPEKRENAPVFQNNRGKQGITGGDGLESSRPSQAVGSRGYYFRVGENPPHSPGLGWRAPVSDGRFLVFRSLRAIRSWKSRRILRSATSCGASRDAH